MSYVGLNLMLNLAVPIALATIAQLCIITVNDLDLGIGAYVGFAACVAATCWSRRRSWASRRWPAASWSMPRLGALIHLRGLPSIVVTLGMSFVWLGLSVLILPTPGGKAPEWVRWLMTLKPPFVPLPIIAAAVIALVAHVAADADVLRRGPARRRRQSQGRRAGGLVAAAVKMVMFALAGFFGMLAGLALLGLTTSADANIALALHPALDRRRHPRRRRVRGRAGLARRRGHRRHDPDAGRLVPLVPAHPARLADRRAGGDPDHRPGAAGADRPHGAGGRDPRLLAKPWLWAWLAAGLVWLATGLVTGGQGAGRVLTAAFTFATFFVLVGLGQMFVITLGPGNVDLSIPATITLAGAVATKVMDTPGR